MKGYAIVVAALAAIASASPQNIDFAAIAAAPTVASGPFTSAGGAIQTASLYTSFSVSGATTAPSTAPTTQQRRGVKAQENIISSDITISTYSAGLGQSNILTTIQRGVTYWLNGGSTHNFLGNINNFGRIFVSQTNYLLQFPFTGGQTSDWVGHDASNGNLNNAQGALIQLNDIGSASAPTYDWYLRSIVNNGTIQWCGRGDTGGCTFQMYSDLDAQNNGLISFEQASSNLGASFVWRNPTLTTTTSTSNLYNNGAFRLVNVVYHNVQNVYGNGCWQIGVGGVLYLEDGTSVFQNPTKGPSLPGQSVSFTDSTAVLHMDTAVYSRSSDFGAKVYGFGAGNAIEFYETIKTFGYANGILTVNMVSGNSVNIKLGAGYDSNLFYKNKNPQKYNTAGYNAIFYKGACPSQSAPAQCSLSAPICSGLGGGLPPTQTSTVISSSSVSSSSTASPSSSSTSSSSTSSSSSATSSSSSSTSSSSSPSSSSTITSPPSSSSSVVTVTPPPTTSTTQLTTATPVCSNTPYTPYYPALATSYTTDPALTATTTSGQACPTQPEAGTYCGFINPEDPCSPQPDGYGPVPSPDTADAFLADPELHSLAQAAPTQVPSYDGTVYQQVFKDLNASTSAQSYLGLYTLQSYNVSQCANLCDCNNLCTAFNIYAERDPSLNPSANDSSAATVWGYWCPNPPSMTTFRCTLWGSNIDASTATNQGEYREQFHVVITASDGYDKTNVSTPINPSGPSGSSSSSIASLSSVTSTSSSSTLSTVALTTTSASSTSVVSSSISSAAQSTSSTLSSTSVQSPSSTTRSGAASTPTSSWPGNGGSHPWGPPHNCHGKAIDAPDFWLGSRFFPGPFNPQLCSDFALVQNNVNSRQSAGQSCKMFNAYYLHKNGKPHGTYCALFNSPLDGDKWATNDGGNYGVDEYECKQSWTYTLA